MSKLLFPLGCMVEYTGCNFDVQIYCGDRGIVIFNNRDRHMGIYWLKEKSSSKFYMWDDMKSDFKIISYESF